MRTCGEQKQTKSSVPVNGIEWFENVDVAGCILKLKVDTGSQVNILNFKDFRKLGIERNQLLPASSTFSPYSGHPIAVVGQITFQCKNKNVKTDLPFYVLRRVNLPKVSPPPMVGRFIL